MNNYNDAKQQSFLSEYFNEYKSLLDTSNSLFKDLIYFSDLLKEMHTKGNKAIIVGNGGSAAIASHFSVDLTKNSRVRCINFNEADLITCFANDYGFDNWIKHGVDFYGDEGDIFIGISSSGKSNDIINGCYAAKEKRFSKIVTFSGFEKNNPLINCGNLNFWVNSKAYNMVENIHQFWLLTVVDLIIGESEYSVS